MEIFLKKKSGVDRKENKMRYKKALLAACATVLPVLQAENVCAMGGKAEAGCGVLCERFEASRKY